ncbi:MAG: hypothetical protein RL148_861 [Planctomycetota bacterium]|jgi:Entner-Doudoroff aldolase
MSSNRQAVLDILRRERCSAILRTSLPDAVRPALDAAVQGGFRVVEVTLTTPNALGHIRDLARRPELLVGAGTVLTPEEARAAVDAGARFLVSPVTDPAVIQWCFAHDVVSVPGTFTPTEMLAAHRAGADLVKLFPAAPGGADYVKAVLGPLPFLKVFPTAGVTELNAAEFLRAGAFGVGFVGTLFVPDDVKNGRWDAIARRAAAMVAAVRSAG